MRGDHSFDHQLMTGEFVLIEHRRVLEVKLKVPPVKVAAPIQFLRKHHIKLVPDEPSEINDSDEDDHWVLESAIKTNADILVTGDKDLLDISKDVSQLRIIALCGFWERLKK